jgi:hypothetical protein
MLRDSEKVHVHFLNTRTRTMPIAATTTIGASSSPDAIEKVAELPD